MGVYRGAILELHKNRLKRRAAAQAAGTLEQGRDKRAQAKLDVKLAGQAVDVREEDGKFYINNEEVSKDSYDSAVTRNRISQQAQKNVSAGYGVGSKESTAPAQVTTPKPEVVPLEKKTEVKKADEVPKIKVKPPVVSADEQAKRSAKYDKSLVRAKTMREGGLKLPSSVPQKPKIVPEPEQALRFAKQHAKMGQMWQEKDKDPTKVAPQVMTDKPNIMQSSAAKMGQMSSLLKNPNVGGMTIGQEPNTGVVNKQSFQRPLERPGETRQYTETLQKGQGANKAFYADQGPATRTVTTQAMNRSIPIPEQLKRVNPFRPKRGMFQGKGMDIAKPSHLQLAQGWGTTRTGGIVDEDQVPGVDPKKAAMLSKPGALDQRKLTEARKKVMSKFGKDVKGGVSTAYDWMSKLNKWLGKNQRKNKPIY